MSAHTDLDDSSVVRDVVAQLLSVLEHPAHEQEQLMSLSDCN